jgi:methionyl-tRNA formyltransferase
MESLRALVESAYPVVAVVTTPDKPSGRGLRPTPSSVKELAARLGLPVLESENVNSPEFMSRVKPLRPDLVAVVSFGQRLSKEFLEIPRLGCWNLHASLLPKYRGAAPISWAIICGEQLTGVTVIRMVPKVDAGPIASRASLPILPNQSAGELTERLATLGARLLVRTIGEIALGKVTAFPQDESEASFAPTLKKSDGRINWGLTPKELVNFIYGMNPWPGAFSYLHHEKKRTRMTVLEARVSSRRHAGGHARQGRILLASDEGLEVACKRGSILLASIQPEGRRPMSAADYLRGHSVSLGDRFGD